MTKQGAIQQFGPQPCGAKQITEPTHPAALHHRPRTAQGIYRSSVFIPTNKTGEGTEMSRIGCHHPITHTHTHTHTEIGGRGVQTNAQPVLRGIVGESGGAIVGARDER